MTINYDGKEIEVEVEVADDLAATAVLPDLEYGGPVHDADIIDNGVYTIEVWPAGEGLSLVIESEQGCIITCSLRETVTAAEVLECWDTDGADIYEWRAQWGVDPQIEPVADDYDGPCRVWHETHYYAGTCNAPIAGWRRKNRHSGYDDVVPGNPDEDRTGILVWATRAAAQEYVDNYYNAPSAYDGIPQCNCLSHGQAGPDTLYICEA